MPSMGYVFQLTIIENKKKSPQLRLDLKISETSPVIFSMSGPNYNQLENRKSKINMESNIGLHKVLCITVWKCLYNCAEEQAHDYDHQFNCNIVEEKNICIATTTDQAYHKKQIII